MKPRRKLQFETRLEKTAKWASEHKLAIGIGIGATMAVLLGIRYAHSLSSAITPTAHSFSGQARNPVECAVQASEVAEKTVLKSFPETRTVQIAGHVRNLPKQHRHSSANEEIANRLGISLAANQSYISAHSRTYNAA